MKYLSLFQESSNYKMKVTKLDIPKKGVLTCIKDCEIRWKERRDIRANRIFFGSGEHSFYKIEHPNICFDTQYPIRPNWNNTIPINAFKKYLDHFEVVDVSKPFKLEYADQYPRDGIVYYNTDLQKHREDGPAMELPDGQIWYKNGLIHREDGPAWIENGQSKYYLNDKHLKKSDFESLLKTKDELTKDELLDLLSGILDESGEHEIKYQEKSKKWIINIFQNKSENIYIHLSSINDMLIERGWNLYCNFDSDTILLTVR